MGDDAECLRHYQLDILESVRGGIVVVDCQLRDQVWTVCNSLSSFVGAASLIPTFRGSYFSSKFHIFDSVVILAAFVIDVTLHGTDEELGSLVVVFRLWRVFKIIEELSSAGQDSLEKYEDEIQQLREDNRNLRRRLNATSDSRNSAGDGSDEDYDEGNAS